MDCMQIIELPRKQYEGYTLHFDYDTAGYYDVRVFPTQMGFATTFEVKGIPREHRHFTDKLYAPHWDDPRAFGLMNNEGALSGIMEVTKEEWNNRLRITNLLVFDGYRRRGYGSLLMCKAKTLARSMGCRAIILETQSCNLGAIRFYLAQGLTLMGFNACEYSNEDIERHEVRLEMGQLIQNNKRTE